MAIRQYIGARYVTKIYENSLDPSLAEWESGVNYEPLTMVTYNNGSYLSKKEVPANVGDPSSNPTYWVQTGFYNGQIANLQNQIDTINGLITALDGSLDKLIDAYTTPEEFGAVGDGVADDTTAINDALAHGTICVCKQHYKTSSPIEIPKNKKLIVTGVIDYDGIDCAIKFTKKYATLEGWGVITSNGDSAVNIKVGKNVIKNIQLEVTGNYTACIKVDTSEPETISGTVIEEVELYGRDNLLPYGKGIYIHTSGVGTFNENLFTSISAWYFDDALHIHNEGTNPINRNKFLQFDGEGSTKTLYAYSTSAYITDNSFDFRTEEFLNTARIYIDDKVIQNLFKGIGFRPQNFSVINPGAKVLWTSTLALNNIIEGYIYTNSGAVYGYNGSFRVNGDLVVFDVNSKRSTYTFYDNFTFDYSTSVSWVPDLIMVGSAVANITFDLAYRFDYCTSPMKRIQVKNSAGTTVTIKNDTTTLFTGLVPQGVYEVVYMENRDTIQLSKLTMV